MQIGHWNLAKKSTPKQTNKPSVSYIATHSELVAPPVTAHRTAIAALLVVAITLLRWLGLPHPSTTEALFALNVSRSRAYALKDRLQELLGELVEPTGRPPNPPAEPAPGHAVAPPGNFCRTDSRYAAEYVVVRHV